jgi:cell division septum initiation protein DivIVA
MNIEQLEEENQQLQQQIESLKQTLQEMTQRAKLESRYDDLVKAAFYDVIRQAEEALK